MRKERRDNLVPVTSRNTMLELNWQQRYGWRQHCEIWFLDWHLYELCLVHLMRRCGLRQSLAVWWLDIFLLFWNRNQFFLCTQMLSGSHASNLWSQTQARLVARMIQSVTPGAVLERVHSDLLCLPWPDELQQTSHMYKSKQQVWAVVLLQRHHDSLTAPW